MIVCTIQPQRPILITNSSLRPMNDGVPTDDNTKTHTVDIYPQNQMIKGIPDTAEGIESFVQQFFTPADESNRENDNHVSAMTGRPRRRNIGKGQWLLSKFSPTLLICGHDSRDSRCGILGPILAAEFKKRLSNHSGDSSPSSPTLGKPHLSFTSVALISHIGGHAFAGNVIIYFPLRFKWAGTEETSPLAGKGVWYGRVEPQHVDGIVEETLKRGTIIEELLRGVI